jgi:hypothetical protein
MLQMIEATFKETVKRRNAAIEQSSVRNIKNGATDMIRANFRSEFGSPSNTFSVASDSAIACSDSFKIQLGRNDFEKNAISKRADGFLKRMWRECYDQELTCAAKYGKKRCSVLIQSCKFCYQIYLTEEGHCLSCHKTFKSIFNFSEHTAQCEEKRRTDPNWKMQISDYSVPIGVRLLKLQLASIEVRLQCLMLPPFADFFSVSIYDTIDLFGNTLLFYSQASIPSEALLSFWTDVYRKSWGMKLYSTESIGEIFQVLSLFLYCSDVHSFFVQKPW